MIFLILIMLSLATFITVMVALRATDEAWEIEGNHNSLLPLEAGTEKFARLEVVTGTTSK